jgi:CRISPR-associated protein Cmr5
MANPRTTEQLRAERALKYVQEVREGTTKDSEYRTLSSRASAHIQTNGLGQTLAFWRSKGRKKPADVLYEHVSTWVCPQMGWGDKDDLLTKLTQCSTQDYRRATVETMAFLNWLRRFAEAELKAGETENANS